MSQEQWAQKLHFVYKFETVESFWCMFNNLEKPTALPVGTNFHLFKDGIQPAWEDPANQGSGRIYLALPLGDPRNPNPKLNMFYENTVLSLIGEQFEFSDHICGLVMQLRKGQLRMSLWLRKCGPEVQTRLIAEWRQILLSCEDPSFGVPVNYQPHETK
ncbi:putative Eukaryotic initiation factor 4E [Paratrimastix pyriformis]|uniref:Eukaryotic initiation factor 4E n=1 Tax=Paratrimastix pyriformis TaxID=342808 RepID=A0ABQ8UQH3_9EUKA|nr:putative Eukaryotic initiation factor 4E [Paratrimastix pyriformis]